MADRNHRVILEQDVFALTAKAQNELRGSATALAPSALEVLILIDGASTAGETAARVRSVDKGAVLNILAKLLREGLIEFASDQAGSLDFVDFFQTTGPVKPSVAASAKARKEAAATTALLQQKGYFVRIARRANARKKPGDARVPAVLVVEDEASLANLLKHVLTHEGFDVRIAKNRDEIVAEFRRPMHLDLVLLDVVLPDVDGFLVLAKIRQHPALMTLPVVMLTAKTTRAAVLKGLAGGADGYITKPFEIEVLIKAVKVVLGLSEDGQAAGRDKDLWP